MAKDIRVLILNAGGSKKNKELDLSLASDSSKRQELVVNEVHNSVSSFRKKQLSTRDEVIDSCSATTYEKAARRRTPLLERWTTDKAIDAFGELP